MKTALVTGVIAAALLVAPPAMAAEITGGKTVLKPDVDTFEGFADMSTSVGATGAAKDTKNGVVFPISGGDFANSGKASVLHRGGLVFSQNIPGGQTLKFSKFTVQISAKGKGKVFAKSAQSEIRFLDLDLSDATLGGTSSIVKIKGAAATLAKPTAQLMSAEFDFPFRKGIPIGTMNIKASLSG
jgi:hypothetical protein